MKNYRISSNGNDIDAETKWSVLSGMDLEKINRQLRGMDPVEIIHWVLSVAKRPVITTNFGPYSASLLHAATRAKKDISVIWCDTGYNTPHTYRHAKRLMEKLSLNMHIYTPKHTTGFRDVTLGIPEVDTEEHKKFTHEVKLEPFKRAFAEHEPDVWFTNLRKEQTEFRKNLDILHRNKAGILKVSPFFHYSEMDIELYLERFNLPNEKKYFDPTKVLNSRECGLHL